MDQQRKQAYRYLLYHAMLEIRPIAWLPLGILNPFTSRKTAAHVRCAGTIADWLHNLAFFSATDFEGFNENWFWDEFRDHQSRYPELAIYKNIFERELTGDGHIRGKS